MSTKNQKKFADKRSFKKDMPLIPGYLIMFLWVAFTFFAIGWMVLASVSTTKEILSGKMMSSGLHFENYYNALIKQSIARYFLNSFIYASTSVVGIILISAPAAYALSRYEFKGKKLISSMMAAALGIPIVMIILPLYSAMVSFNLTGKMSVLIVLYILINVPFTSIFLMSFFQTLPDSLEESALIDGCTPAQTFWKIYLPLAQSGIITVSIFNFITIWNEYFIALIFLNKAELRTLALGLQSMIQSMRYTGDWAGMFAAVIVVFLPTFILYIFLSEKIIGGITGGSVKG